MYRQEGAPTRSQERWHGREGYGTHTGYGSQREKWEAPAEMALRKTLASSSPFTPGRRFVLNVTGIFLNVILPWFVFTVVLYMVSFKYHYVNANAMWATVTGVAVLAIFIPFGLWIAERNSYEPNWYKFTAGVMALAVGSAIGIGYANYWYNTMIFYDWQRLKIYPSVDPSKEFGQNLMDAGTVYFSEGSAIDVGKGWHFMSDQAWHGIHNYCVAPIVKGAPLTGTYDFWAIGKDCCSSSSSDFRCGEFDNGLARSGLRLLDDISRPFYELAVKQAVAQYSYGESKITANHPIFFEWVQDPLAHVTKYMDWGNNIFLVSCVGFLAFQACLVAITTFCFAQIGRRTCLTACFASVSRELNAEEIW